MFLIRTKKEYRVELIRIHDREMDKQNKQKTTFKITEFERGMIYGLEVALSLLDDWDKQDK